MQISTYCINFVFNTNFKSKRKSRNLTRRGCKNCWRFEKSIRRRNLSQGKNRSLRYSNKSTPSKPTGPHSTTWSSSKFTRKTSNQVPQAKEVTRFTTVPHTPKYGIFACLVYGLAIIVDFLLLLAWCMGSTCMFLYKDLSTFSISKFLSFAILNYKINNFCLNQKQNYVPTHFTYLSCWNFWITLTSLLYT